MSLIGIAARTKTVNEVRTFLIDHGFTELTPQLMEKTQPTEPAIFQFKAGNYYLATSPEGFLKRAMAAGVGNCFAVSHCFRSLEGENELHKPDFLMSEFYIKNSSYHEVMNLVQELISHILHIKDKKPWPRISIIDLWNKYIGVSYTDLIDEEKMVQFAIKKGYSTEGANWEALFTQIHFNEVEKYYPLEPFFIIDFPKKTSPLCKSKKENPLIAERFELLINKIELANGNSENFNYREIQTMMKEECKKQGTPLDTGFITALKKLQNETWAGVGIGIDRLAMLSFGIKSIAELVQP